MKIKIRQTNHTKPVREWEHLFGEEALLYYDLVIANIPQGTDFEAVLFSFFVMITSPLGQSSRLRYFKRTVDQPKFQEVTEEEYYES